MQYALAKGYSVSGTPQGYPKSWKNRFCVHMHFRTNYFTFQKIQPQPPQWHHDIKVTPWHQSMLYVVRGTAKLTHVRRRASGALALAAPLSRARPATLHTHRTVRIRLPVRSRIYACIYTSCIYSYVYIYAYSYKHIYTYMYVCIYIFTYLYMYVYTHHKYVYMCMYIHIMHIDMCTYIHTYIYRSKWIYIHIYTYLYVHIYIYMYVYVCQTT